MTNEKTKPEPMSAEREAHLRATPDQARAERDALAEALSGLVGELEREGIALRAQYVVAAEDALARAKETKRAWQIREDCGP